MFSGICVQRSQINLRIRGQKNGIRDVIWPRMRKRLRVYAYSEDLQLYEWSKDPDDTLRMLRMI